MVCVCSGNTEDGEEGVTLMRLKCKRHSDLLKTGSCTPHPHIVATLPFSELIHCKVDIKFPPQMLTVTPQF